MLVRTTPSFSLIAVLLAAACGDRSSDSSSPLQAGGGSSNPGDPSSDAGADAPVCAFGQIICEGDTAKTCDGKGGFIDADTKQCVAKCSDGLGCVQCMPNTGSCGSTIAKVCDPSGTQEVNFLCDGPGMQCEADGCKGDCSPTTLGLSYRGCEFWPTVTSNSVWSDRSHQGAGGFHFGVLLGNDSPKATAKVTITREGSKPYELALAPGQVMQQALDWVPELKGPDWEMPFLPAGPAQSVKKGNGAYHIVSDSPIIAYQFNALEGRAGNNAGCPMLPGGFGGCYSYSNDASLLIPAHALASSYVVAGYHAWHSDHFPQNGAGKLNMGDFITITATANTQVTVNLRPNQGVLPSAGTDLPRFTVGGKTTFPMDRGMVVQLFTPGLSENDTFGGTEITAAGANGAAATPIQIISGMGCASIPEDVSPCGHVEDLVLPSDALGKDYVVPALIAASSIAIAQTIRIQAISDGTALTFEPSKFNSVTLNAVTLNRGEVLELPSIAFDVRITSTTPFAVTQYMNGRGDVAKASPDGQNVGGPNQLSVPPTGQFRTDYAFIASPIYDINFVSIVAPTGTAVAVDGQSISPERFIAVGATGMSVTRHPVSKNDRVHVLHADKPVGIFVFGYNPFSSYMYSGGFDLKRSSAIVR